MHGRVKIKQKHKELTLIFTKGVSVKILLLHHIGYQGENSTTPFPVVEMQN